MRLLLAALLGLALYGQERARFLPASDCALCHTRIPKPGGAWQDAAGWIGPANLWKNSMMAHSARDPYWRAKVAFETALAPAEKAEIEDTCLRCHAPADQYPKRAAGGRLALAELTDLGRDGVTCTICHQITPDALGKPASFTGSFTLGTNDRIFGPYPEPFSMPMRMHTGFTATEGRHVRESALCGTCHTVITQPRGGKAPFVEQAPFLEWLASGYPAQGATCQHCHMPALDAPQYIAHRPPGGPFPPTSPRSPAGQHVFAGANTLVPAALGNTEMAERARQQLGRALRLEVRARREGGDALVQVEVTNLTGHKLPTAYPSRRLWLQLRAANSAGRVVFESGAWDSGTGELRGDDSPVVFAAEAASVAGRPTVSLLQAAVYLRDTRIPPAGFRVERLQQAGLGGFDIAPTGVPEGLELRPGAATANYRIPAVGPLTFTVEALFQSIQPAHRLPAFPIPAQLAGPVTLATAQASLR